jgi:sn-glycerol 3-phosphate transport system permease protein
MTAAAFLSGRRSARASQGVSFYGASWLDTLAAWTLALLWLLPLAYAVWTAFHPSDASTRLDLSAPWTLQNFRHAWEAAPFARYFLNTILLVAMILAVQLLLSTLAAFAFARFRGSNVAFALVLIQLMIMPDILLVANYQTMSGWERSIACWA